MLFFNILLLLLLLFKLALGMTNSSIYEAAAKQRTAFVLAFSNSTHFPTLRENLVSLRLFNSIKRVEPPEPDSPEAELFFANRPREGLAKKWHSNMMALQSIFHVYAKSEPANFSWAYIFEDDAVLTPYYAGCDMSDIVREELLLTESSADASGFDLISLGVCNPLGTPRCRSDQTDRIRNCWGRCTHSLAVRRNTSEKVFDAVMALNHNKNNHAFDVPYERYMIKAGGVPTAGSYHCASARDTTHCGLFVQRDMIQEEAYGCF